MSKAVMRPAADDYAPYYAKYVTRVGEGPIVNVLASQIESTLELLRSIPEERADERYEPGKWSIKELVGHVVDAERIFSYRALRISRGDKTPLPGFEQDLYVENGPCARVTLAELVDELEHLRKANVLMFRGLDETAWERRGTASDNEVSVRAIAYIIAGHELHHVEVLRERYLKG